MDVDADACDIFAVAGETSGDLLGGLLWQGLRQQAPELNTQGIVGPRLAAAGCRAWADSETLAVRGYVEALSALPRILWLRRRLLHKLSASPPGVFLGIDAPDFNLGVEQRLRQQGVPTVHFVCPSIWAWRPERVEVIRRAADRVLCLFPCEPALLARAGIDAVDVGHPLADAIPMAPDQAGARQRLGLARNATVVAILPGSRRSEVALNAPMFLQTAVLLRQALPEVQMILPAANAGLAGAIQQLPAWPAARAAGVVLLQGQSHEALAACDVTLIASGTATLEAMLFKRPMVIGYRVPSLTYRYMKSKALLPYVGLPNILTGRWVVPEFIQDAAQPAAMAQAVLHWLERPLEVQALHEVFAEQHLRLRRDTANAGAAAVLDLLHTRRKARA